MNISITINRSLIIIILSVVLNALSCSSVAEQSEPLTANPRLGINLSKPYDGNTELPFVNVFRISQPWISKRTGAKSEKGPKLLLDEYGWVRKLAPGCFAVTNMCSINDAHYPGGHYTV